MIEWSESHLMIRDTVRRFVEAEIVPNLEELKHGDTPLRHPAQASQDLRYG